MMLLFNFNNLGAAAASAVRYPDMLKFSLLYMYEGTVSQPDINLACRIIACPMARCDVHVGTVEAPAAPTPQCFIVAGVLASFNERKSHGIQLLLRPIPFFPEDSCSRDRSNTSDG